MCGIYLTVTVGEYVDSGTQCSTTTLPTTTTTTHTQQRQPPPPPDWLLRRGPDAWNTIQVVQPCVNGTDPQKVASFIITVTLYASVLQMRDTCVTQPIEIHDASTDSATSPQMNTTTASHPLHLAWNGEIYEYYNIRQERIESVYHSHISDTKLLSQLLLEQVVVHMSSTTTSTTTNISSSGYSYNNIRQQQEQIATVLGQLTNAEYAFCIMTEDCIYYGRDVFGRRSLLTGTHTSSSSSSSSHDTFPPTTKRMVWELASVATSSNHSDNIQWQEVHPGMVHAYPIRRPSEASANGTECMVLPPIPIQCMSFPNGELSLNSTAPLRRFDIESVHAGADLNIQEYYCQILHNALLNAVRCRCCTSTAANIHNPGDENSTTITNHITPLLISTTAILFSGGLDSTVIAALALEAGVSELTLFTVSFIDQHDTATALPLDTTTTSVTKTATHSTTVTAAAADAVAAEQSYHELCQLYPQATIHFVHKIVDWEQVQIVEERIRTLAYPKTTSVMDVNIATALWFAASAIPDPSPLPIMEDLSHTGIDRRLSPRILLSGLGADELMGGYGRHRHAYHRGGSDELQKELQMDMNRLWERNLGRDDRILSDTSKELRFPFLDPNVIRVIQSIPLQYVVDYTFEGGVGDKRILRLMAQQMGLATATSAVKRAIQFGSRISHVSDKRRYGSRRKANANSKS